MAKKEAAKKKTPKSDDEKELGPAVAAVPLHAGDFMFLCTHQADGEIDGAKFEVASNIGGALIIDFHGDSDDDTPPRYVVPVLAAIRVAWDVEKARRAAVKAAG